MSESYVRELDSINNELKRIRSHVKQLTIQKKIAEKRLYDYMKRNNLEKCGNYNIKKITPKPKVPRKTQKQKKQDAINLFKMKGIENPEKLFEEFKNTQKSINGGESSSSRTKSEKNKFDQFLGF